MCGVAVDGAVWCGVVRCGVVRCGVVGCGVGEREKCVVCVCMWSDTSRKTVRANESVKRERCTSRRSRSKRRARRPRRDPCPFLSRESSVPHIPLPFSPPPPRFSTTFCRYVALEIHSYDPYGYTSHPATVHSWGSDQDRKEMQQWITDVSFWASERTSWCLGFWG